MTLVWDKLNLDFQQHGLWECWQAFESLSGIKREVKMRNGEPRVEALCDYASCQDGQDTPVVRQAAAGTCTLGTVGHLSKGVLGRTQRIGLIQVVWGMVKDVGVHSGLRQDNTMTGYLHKSFLDVEQNGAGLKL